MILITGATGKVGKELVSQLLKREKPIRVLSRDSRKFAHLDPRIERFVGDLDKPKTLGPAFEGVERVFLITFQTQQDIHVIEAAKRADIRQVVKLSTLEASKPHLKVGKWHREREDLIEASGLGWTFLRPGMFMTNTIEWWGETIKKRRAVYFPGGKGRVAPIDPRDVAAVATTVMTQPGHSSRIYELTGPELLTIDDMAQTIGRVLGENIVYVNVPLIAAKVQMMLSGLDRELVGALMEVANELHHDRGAQLTDTVEHITGRQARTFEAWCRENIKEFQDE
jgi:uncharacterized protein YbjT (DUF2867 family)